MSVHSRPICFVWIIRKIRLTFRLCRYRCPEYKLGSSWHFDRGWSCGGTNRCFHASSKWYDSFEINNDESDTSRFSQVANVAQYTGFPAVSTSWAHSGYGWVAWWIESLWFTVSLIWCNIALPHVLSDQVHLHPAEANMRSVVEVDILVLRKSWNPWFIAAHISTAYNQTARKLISGSSLRHTKTSIGEPLSPLYNSIEILTARGQLVMEMDW